MAKRNALSVTEAAENTEEADTSPPPSSFKGALKQFEYLAKPTGDLRRSKRVFAKRDSQIKEGSHDSPSALTSASTSVSASPSPLKKRRQSSKYAAPEKYSHLSPLRDVLEPNLICVFIGVNPGIQTARSGHAYAHPSNQFWKLLHSSGCTDRRCRPEEDGDLPRLYSMGNTNIVSRPTKDAAELSKSEMANGTATLDEKILKYKPEAVCLVGKGIWEAVWKYRYGRYPTKAEFHYGWQEERENMGKSKPRTEEKDAWGNEWRGARVFVATSSSGLAASLKPAEKEAIWLPFGQWVKHRREERALLTTSSDNID